MTVAKVMCLKGLAHLTLLKLQTLRHLLFRLLSKLMKRWDWSHPCIATKLVISAWYKEDKHYYKKLTCLYPKVIKRAFWHFLLTFYIWGFTVAICVMLGASHHLLLNSLQLSFYLGMSPIVSLNSKRRKFWTVNFYLVYCQVYSSQCPAHNSLGDSARNAEKCRTFV